MACDAFESTDSLEPTNRFGRTASEDESLVADYEESARETVCQANGDQEAVMKAYMFNQSMRTMLDPEDAVLNEAYAARSRILKEEMLLLGVEDSWFAQWEDAGR
ncbi:MAG: hypothetical protein J5804_05750 [Eggerthellaceae bacterium]|nr:hypothetical protein [Eggerthellaceae bacterium]